MSLLQGAIRRLISGNNNPFWNILQRRISSKLILTNNNSLGSEARNEAGCIIAASVSKTSHKKSNNHEVSSCRTNRFWVQWISRSMSLFLFYHTCLNRMQKSFSFFQVFVDNYMKWETGFHFIDIFCFFFFFFEKEKDNKRDKESIKNPISKYMFMRRLTDTKHNLAYFLPDLRKIAFQIKLF